MSKRENLNRDSGKGKYKEVLTLALLVGILPPTWALISPYIGVHVGPIALIAAGIYGANGNKFEDSFKIAAGYIAGDIWSLIITTVLMQKTSFNANLTLWFTLFILGFIAVIISAKFPRYVYLPSFLAGWAIAMLSMNLDETNSLIRMTIEIGVAMLVGVYYVGALIDKIHKIVNNR